MPFNAKREDGNAIHPQRDRQREVTAILELMTSYMERGRSDRENMGLIRNLSASIG